MKHNTKTTRSTPVAPGPHATQAPAAGARVRATLAGALLVLALAAGWGSPAHAQSASPAASAPSEETTQLLQETTSVAGGGGELPDGVSSRGVQAGPVQISDDCVKAGPVQIGDCKGGGSGSRGGGGNQGVQGGDPGGDPGGGQEEEPEDVAPEGTTPEQPGGDADEDADPPATPDDEAACDTVGPLEKTREAAIERVTDGDTAELEEPVKGTTTVRFIGVDTPETVDPEEEPEPYGKEASTFTEKALEGETVALELDQDAKDDYDRLLAYVWAEDGEGDAYLFNEALLEGGYGQLMIVEPNDAYEGCLGAAEDRAREAGAGLWGLEEQPTPDPTDPPDTEPVDNPDPTEETPTEKTPTEEPQVVDTEQADPASPDPASPEPASPDPETTAAPETTTAEAPEGQTPETTSAPEASAPPATEEASPPAETAEEAPDDPLTSAFGSPQSTPEPLETADPPEDLALGGPPAASAPPDVSPAEDQYAADPGVTPGAAPVPEVVLPDSGGREIAAIETRAAGGTDAAGATAVLLGSTLVGLAAGCGLRNRNRMAG